MRFAIVDDEKNMISYLLELLKKLIRDKTFEVDSFTDSSLFLKECVKKPYDAFFLDIDMPEPNGFKLAEILHENKSEIPIIYVTGRDELIINAFRYRPLGFIRKQNMESELAFALSTLFEQTEKTSPTITVTELRSKGGRKHCIIISHIAYIESENHNINIHLTNGDVIIARKSLSEYISHDDFRDFILINSGVFVNLNHVRINDHKVILSDGNVLYISRRKVQAVREAYMKSQRRILI